MAGARSRRVNWGTGKPGAAEGVGELFVCVERRQGAWWGESSKKGSCEENTPPEPLTGASRWRTEGLRFRGSRRCPSLAARRGQRSSWEQAGDVAWGCPGWHWERRLGLPECVWEGSYCLSEGPRPLGTPERPVSSGGPAGWRAGADGRLLLFAEFYCRLWAPGQLRDCFPGAQRCRGGAAGLSCRAGERVPTLPVL